MVKGLRMQPAQQACCMIFTQNVHKMIFVICTFRAQYLTENKTNLQEIKNIFSAPILVELTFYNSDLMKGSCLAPRSINHLVILSF